MQYSDYQRAKQRDEQIDQIHQLTLRMKHAGKEMGAQLSRQQQMVRVLQQEMEMTEDVLGGLNKQVGQLLQTKDVSQACTCLMLCCLMILVIILIIIF